MLHLHCLWAEPHICISCRVACAVHSSMVHLHWSHPHAHIQTSTFQTPVSDFS